jgi:hypothetical protein
MNFMKTYKIYKDNHTELVSLGNYQKWLIENAPFYFVGPHITKDNREIYTAYTANLPGSSCFTTFEVLLDENGKEREENIYYTEDWQEARELHKKLLKAKKAENVSIHNAKAFS